MANGAIMKQVFLLLTLGCFLMAVYTQFSPWNTTTSLLRRRLAPVNFLPQNSFSHEVYLADPMSVVDKRVHEWMNQLPSKYEQAANDPTVRAFHNRFFPFKPLATCRQQEPVGGPNKSDAGKQMCGLDNLQSPGCIIYSTGENNWEFEKDVLEKTACEVHSFDCTGPKERFSDIPINPRLHFHHICIRSAPAPAQECIDNRALCGVSSTLDRIQTLLGHTSVDVLKMDIEGWEVPMIRSWASMDHTKLPRQVLVELHWRTHFLKVNVPDNRAPQDFLLEVLTPWETVDFCLDLLKMGYVTAERSDNQYCDHCSELTLINVKEFSSVPWMA